MTDKEIQEGNKLIAEFMEGKLNILQDGFGNNTEVFWFLPGNNPNPHCNAGTYKRPQQLEYHSRWDWLMPVVEKICSLVYKQNGSSFRVVVTISGDCTIFYRTNWPIGETHVFISCCKGDKMIDHCWYAVLDCIQYYNENNRS